MIRLTTGCRRLDAVCYAVPILLVASSLSLNGQDMPSGQELQRPMHSVVVVEPNTMSTAWAHEIAQTASKSEVAVVAFKPPQSIVEQPSQPKPIGSHVQWIQGYWAWDAARAEFVWVNGLWRNIPANQSWVTGFWKQQGESYRWNPGFWTISELASIHEHDATAGVYANTQPVVIGKIVVPPSQLRPAQRERELLVRQQALRIELAILNQQSIELEANARVSAQDSQNFDRQLDRAAAANLIAQQQRIYDDLIREQTRIQRQNEFQFRLESEQRENLRLDLEARIRHSTTQRTTEQQRLADQQQQIQRNRDEFQRQKERMERRADGDGRNKADREIARVNREVQQARADRERAEKDNLTTEQARLRDQQLQIQRNREEFARQKEQQRRQDENRARLAQETAAAAAQQELARRDQDQARRQQAEQMRAEQDRRAQQAREARAASDRAQQQRMEVDQARRARELEQRRREQEARDARNKNN